MRKVTVAATQMACSPNKSENVHNAEKIIKEAAAKGANIILLQELFETQYFCQVVNSEFFKMASPFEGNETIEFFAELAKDLDVVIPVSFYEVTGQTRFNSLVVIDADGTILDLYRKTHLPDDPGYYEKYYFSPGDTGFKVWDTKYAKIGVGICWDQWFPETARSLALKGAELLFFPTAIGTLVTPKGEPYDEPEVYDHWQNTMFGHAAANMTPVIASNRIGIESFEETSIKFGGNSFISDQKGNIIVSADRDSEAILTATFDLDELEAYRRYVPLFRDRRPEHYKTLLTLDGKKSCLVENI